MLPPTKKIKEKVKVQKICEVTVKVKGNIPITFKSNIEKKN